MVRRKKGPMQKKYKEADYHMAIPGMGRAKSRKVSVSQACAGRG
jgi:hypothetical protein